MYAHKVICIHVLRTIDTNNIEILHLSQWKLHSAMNCLITDCSSEHDSKMDMSSYKKYPLHSPLKDEDFIEVIDSEDSNHERYHSLICTHSHLIFDFNCINWWLMIFRCDTHLTLRLSSDYEMTTVVVKEVI